ncbi:siderophore-interacting protein [Homoserinibacter sp. YIM 151385]|uniref:siderophore-interacting protein n=1 Tax=Homoserinibacter sp. YIM 151385 TaxID=2985506 RepID=UPI0022EFDC28|nr:siderophore-interacting protein [Homoserinibacter sp. YIM 151385]WBU39246.1 siderophore-interacting protein [Homoserinibacter sp. YIM 151385]
MLTYADDVPLVREDRPSYRCYTVRVARIQRLAPHFVRVTFTADELRWIGTDAQDQRIKIVFPLEGVLHDFGQHEDNESGNIWYSRLREMPLEQRNPFRTYTVRGARPADRELDVDFVNHGDEGPAAQWINRVELGDEVVVVGPDARSLHSAGGIDWRPGPATRVLLAGDETAAPAICAILEGLPEHVAPVAFIEVPSAADALPLSRNAERVTWIARDGAVHGERLEAAVRDFTASHRELLAPALREVPEEVAEVDVDVELLWDSPVDAGADFYAWLAGESSVIKTLRRHLVTELGMDRRQVAFMGYWRAGRAEAQE